MKIIHEIDFGDKKLSLEIGELAQRSRAAVFAKLGETVVLATVCSAKSEAETDFLPLTVDYEEKLYAAGRISTSRFIKREGRPSVEAILSDRLIDRSIRPLFDKNFSDQVQVVITTLSYDGENDPQILAAIATSAALLISGLPWTGPLATVKVGRMRDEFILNPTETELPFSDLDLVMSASSAGIVMIEAQASQMSEDELIQALKFGQSHCLEICQALWQFAKKAGVKDKPAALLKSDQKLEKTVKEFIDKAYSDKFKKELDTDEVWINGALEELYTKFGSETNKFILRKILEGQITENVQNTIFAGSRIDGRKPDEIRQISARVGLLPRTHGSALFSRGDTQVLSITTLGSPALEQLIDGMTGEETKRFMHHYNFPPFSTGEVRRVGSPGRREIGHGALAEKALMPIIPNEEKFPYTIRIVSEVLSSAGSTSMASVCALSLALMDAGVPIAEPVAGVAIGSFSQHGKRILLTDIAYTEDSRGEMDFKVAGTKNGITAIQMDLKIQSQDLETLEKALERAKTGRLQILDVMNKVLEKSRTSLSPFAPKVKVVHIPAEKIGEIIGSGGRVIRQIMTQTSTVIDVEDDGTVSVSGSDEQLCQKAVSLIEALTKKVTPGEVFEGVVKRILPFGAMVEYLPGREGLVHISQMAPFRINNVGDFVKIGQKVKVKVSEIDPVGRINLSMRLDDGQKNSPAKKPDNWKKRFRQD